MGAYARDVPRPHRVQAAGIRHVVCRGIRGLPIFVDDFDREWYLGMLGLVCRDFGWRVLAWCLMTNHVHLVVDVPEDTISRGMQLLSGNYGQAFNWRHGHTGHLFQGRFHDELVDGASYGLTVVRYVDRNPERAGVVDDAAAWRWSSYRALVGLDAPRRFHDTAWTLEQFSRDRARARELYADFVAAGRTHPVLPPGRVRSGHGRGLTPDVSQRDTSVREGDQPTP